MTNGVHRHPFQAGEQYRTEKGVYTVLEIDEPDMVVQYEDGETQRVSIALLKRIWDRIQDEKAIAAKQVKAKQRAQRRSGGRARAAWGRDFHGLQETDFRRDLAGTTWRRRSELGGLLAARLSDLSEQAFESRVVPRRPEVYIVQPHYYSRDRSRCAAKFFFQLAEEGARYGFYIEKSHKPMDDTWDWPRFLAALGEDKSLQAHTLIAMEHGDLRWEVYPEVDNLSDPILHCVTAVQETLYLQGPDDDAGSPIGWDGFIDLLAALPEDRWCNLYLAAQLDKARAIELGVGLASEAANVYDALLPLYTASVKR